MQERFQGILRMSFLQSDRLLLEVRRLPVIRPFMQKQVRPPKNNHDFLYIIPV
jgi:hypothetical protein